MRIMLTKTNRNRLDAGTHSLATVLRNQGFKLYPQAARAPSAVDLRGAPTKVQPQGGMGSGCPTAIRTPSLDVYVAEGVIDPQTKEPVRFADIRVQ